MSISHWGFFPGVWIACVNQPYTTGWGRQGGSVHAEWLPCPLEELVQWR